MAKSTRVNTGGTGNKGPYIEIPVSEVKNKYSTQTVQMGSADPKATDQTFTYTVVSDPSRAAGS